MSAPNLIFNKLIALVLIGAGVFVVWMEGDGTFLIFALMIGVPLLFAKENWTTIEVREFACFFEQELRYHYNMLLWKIEARLMNRYEWKCYYRNERRKRRT